MLAFDSAIYPNVNIVRKEITLRLVKHTYFVNVIRMFINVNYTNNKVNVLVPQRLEIYYIIILKMYSIK
ncbi:hypothetical protein BLOT_000764 [Blomia tropicalis]|nr:hypothetical protein BLOT_000764 [Blomia tropicalis]